MALTSAEKQRRYRERHLGFDGNKDRLQLLISVPAKAQLARLARHRGYTITKLIEDLAEQAERVVIAELPWKQHKNYYDGHLLEPAAAPAKRKLPTPKPQTASPRKTSPRASRRPVTL
jgi:hypothetical protein